MKKHVAIIIFCLLLNILSYNVGASTTIPATGVSYGGTTVAATLDSLITKANIGDATAAQILSGKTALVQGATITGTMPNNGIGTEAGSVVVFNSNLYYRIPVGYYAVNSGHGQSEVRAPFSTVASTVGLTANKLAKGHTILGITGTYTSDATATAADITSGKTAYVNGIKLTGTSQGYSIVKIWTNSSPSTAISSGTISIPTEYQDYKYAYYTNRVSTSSTAIMNSRINANPNSTSTKQQITTFNYSSDGNVYRRVVNFYSDRVVIAGCGNTSTGTTTNGQLIPYEIYLIV